MNKGINDSTKYNIICLSNQLWDFPNWTNKRHVMYRIAKAGNNVLFVDPPINTGNVFLKQILKGLWKFKRLLFQYKTDDCGAIVYTPLNIVPFSEVTSALHTSRINGLSRKFFDPNKKTILWVYHVQMQQLKKYLDNVKYDILVYDCVDNYLGFPDTSAFYATSVTKSKVREQEEMLARRANVVFCTAPGLVDRLKKFNANTHFAPNVGDYERFVHTNELKSSIPDDLKVIPRPRIGYIGALDDYKFDYALLKKCAKDHPSYSFVIIGPMALKDKEATVKELGFEGYSNVYFLGSRPYEDKAKYMAGFDVDMIPYVLNDYTVGGCFPVKFHDSLSAGLPIVVTDLPAYYPFKSVCYLSKNHSEFSVNIQKALEENTGEKLKQRQEMAKQNTWDGKVASMLKLVKSSL